MGLLTAVKPPAKRVRYDYTINNQEYPSVSGLSDSGFVVAWESYGQDGSGYGIYAQRYEANGTRLGNEFRVNTNTNNSQSFPSVSGLSDGGFVVVWQSDLQEGSGYGIYGRRFIVPIVLSNQLSIRDGQTLILNATNLNIIFPHNYDVPLQVINLQHGQFELTWSPGKAVSRFYPQWIEYGWVQFRHDDSEIAPTYEIMVDDGGLVHDPYVPVIYFTLVNDNFPLLVNNRLILQEEETLLFSSANLNATDADVDQDLGALNFTIQTLQHGRFEFTSQPNVPIFSFLQGHIWNNTVRFIHDGGEIAPSYNVTVSDGSFTSPSQAAVINFTQANDTPTWVNNNFTFTQGQNTILTPNMLSAFDPEHTDTQIRFLIRNVQKQHGQFERLSNLGVAILDFTQQEVKEGQIQFVHDNSEIAPSFDIAITDGDKTTAVIPAKINYININALPQWEKNELTINGGETRILTDSNIQTSDPDNSPEELIIQVIEVKNGYFSYDNQSGVPITQFTQQEIDERKVQFTAQGEVAPAYTLSVKDPMIQTPLLKTAMIVYIPQQTATGDQSRTIIGASVGSALGLTGILIGAGFFAKRKYDENTRKEHELAHAIWYYLKLQGLSNFKSERGKQYVAVVEGPLTAELKIQGIDPQDLSSDEINKLAQHIAIAAKEVIAAKDEVKCGGQVYSPIIPKDIENNVKNIVLKVSEYQQTIEVEEEHSSQEIAHKRISTSSSPPIT